MLSVYLLSAAGAYVHQMLVRHVPCEHGALVHAVHHAAAAVDVHDVGAVSIGDDHDDEHCSAATPPPPVSPSAGAPALLPPRAAERPLVQSGLAAATAVRGVDLLRIAPKGSPPLSA